MIELRTARSGKPSVVVDGKLLHSTYDPERQAQRFVEESFTDGIPSAVIVVGEGLGYVSNAIRNQFPEIPVISFYLDDRLRRYANESAGHRWFPDDPSSPFAFLQSILDEEELEGLRMIEWGPSVHRWPEPAELVRNAVRDIVRELTGNISATAGFGRRWLSNAVRNLIDLPSLRCTLRNGGTVVIAASGPSLNTVLPEISENRDRFELWALPSSLRAINAAGLTPDLVVTTDPGFYAVLHYRYLHQEVAHAAYPITAAPGIGSRVGSALLLDQEGFFERSLLRPVSVPACPVAQNGTVAGTALTLAHALNKEVIFAGLDFVFDDLRMHSRPHTFDELIRVAETRTRPCLTVEYGRFMNTSPARIDGRSFATMPLRTYAAWFERYLVRESGRPVYRLAPSPLRLSGFRDVVRDRVEPFLSSLPATGSATGISSITDMPVTADRGKIAALIGRKLSDWKRVVEMPGSVDSGNRRRLLYLLETRGTLETRRLRREGKSTEAEERENRLVDSVSTFLDSLLRIVACS